eukprot:TRINITY_DN10474_c0_g1_i2.p1 TRINITY_DN10474_c0_g1~~TRINITY_DN10474_c0_g1_i2.p1  ORF type:complete len:900 (+),score=244.75 TRINITY_DN10474_c0_g1_i2:41-2701(+)
MDMSPSSELDVAISAAFPALSQSLATAHVQHMPFTTTSSHMHMSDAPAMPTNLDFGFAELTQSSQADDIAQDPAPRRKRSARNREQPVYTQQSSPMLETDGSLASSPAQMDASQDNEASPPSKLLFTPKHDGLALCLDQHQQPIHGLSCLVTADKGFSYSPLDKCFVAQKKNHFQLSIALQSPILPCYVATADGAGQITGFTIQISAVKQESPHTIVAVEQSRSDRKKLPYQPVAYSLQDARKQAKTKVSRLHFSETTANNMRKKGKPNPNQRHFCLHVKLMAMTDGDAICVAKCVSGPVIVRASNPGQYDNEGDTHWRLGRGVPNAVVHHGSVGINTDKPTEALTVNGNIRLTGNVMQTSDQRVKEDVQPTSTKQQLDNVRKLNLYHYALKPAWAEAAGRSQGDRAETGVLAQELQEVLPDAVRTHGSVDFGDEHVDDLLVVNKERVFMENVGAVQELSKLTDGLDERIKELETLSHRRSTLRKRRTSAAQRPPSRARQLMGVPDDKPFPWLKMGFWLFICALLAVVTVVGVIIMVQQSRSADPTATAAAVAPTTTTTQSPTFTCNDGSQRESLSLCPTRISFTTTGDFAQLNSTMRGYVVHTAQVLALQMGVQLTRVAQLTVTSSLQHMFFLEHASSATELNSATAVANLITAVNNGEVIILYDDAFYTAIDDSVVVGEVDRNTTIAGACDCAFASECISGTCVCTYGADIDDECYLSYTAMCEELCDTNGALCDAANADHGDTCACRDGWEGDRCESIAVTNTHLATVEAYMYADPTQDLKGDSYDVDVLDYVFDVNSTAAASNATVPVVVRLERFNQLSSWNRTAITVSDCMGSGEINMDDASTFGATNLIMVHDNTIVSMAVTVTAGQLSRSYSIAIRRGC